MRKDDEKRIIKKNLKALDALLNDAVKVTRVVDKYDEEAAVMSILGAAFSTWCDARELDRRERWELLRRLMELQEQVPMLDVNVTNGFPGMEAFYEIDADLVVHDDDEKK